MKKIEILFNQTKENLKLFNLSTESLDLLFKEAKHFYKRTVDLENKIKILNLGPNSVNEQLQKERDKAVSEVVSLKAKNHNLEQQLSNLKDKK